MHLSRDSFALERFLRFAPLVLLALAAGCVPAESPRPTTDLRNVTPPPASRNNAGEPADGTVIVRKGDTLYKIARRHGIDLRDLIEINRARPPYYIFEGQRIRLPRPRIHLVRKGDTLYGVSRRYGVDMATLVRINKISPPYRIEAGSQLMLPRSGDRTAPPTETAVAGARAKAPPSASYPTARRLPRVVSTRLPPRSGRRFLWPVNGRIIVGFGPRAGGLHNDGINILARRGTAVRAAENGLVAYSGNELRGFGKLLLIKHAGGWMSAYAHNEKLLVDVGEKVDRGQIIARVGATGSVVRPQLHFELRRGVRVVNPITHLQPLRAEAAPVTPIAFLVAPRDPG